jgi:hypothetical protein
MRTGRAYLAPSPRLNGVVGRRSAPRFFFDQDDRSVPETAGSGDPISGTLAAMVA